LIPRIAIQSTELEFISGRNMKTVTAFVRKKACVLMMLGSLAVTSAALTAGPNVWTSIGPYGGWVHALAIDPKSPGTVYVATPFGAGVFKTTDGGKSWIPAGSGLTGHYVDVLAIDPQNPRTIYAGVEYGGVFKTTDGGTSWKASSYGLPQYPPSVVTLAIDPQDPATVYAGVHGNPGGIFKSTDGGASWNRTGAAIEIGNTVSLLAIDPRNSRTLYSGTYFGLWKSTDGGETWSKVNSGLAFGFNCSLVIDPQNAHTVYAGISGSGVFKSTDGGITWTDTGVPLAYGPVAIDPPDSNIVYAASDGVIFRSTDAGTSWTAGSELGIAARTFTFALAADPLNHSDVYAATQQDGVFKSTDGGTNWSKADSGLAATGTYLLAIDPQSRGTLYTASFGPLLKTTDNGKNWSGRGVLGWVASLAIDPLNPSNLYAGTFGDADFGFPGAIFKSTDGGIVWSQVVSASKTASTAETLSANALAIDPQNPSTTYAAIGGRDFGYGSMGTHGGILKSTDGGASWTVVNAGLPDQISVSTLAIDPQNSGTLYIGIGGDLGYVTPEAASGRVFKSTDGGESWFPASSGLPGNSVTVLLLDPQNSGIVYALTGSGIFKTTDGGMCWSVANTGLPAIGVSALTLDPRNPGTLYAGTLSGVFISTDGAQSWSALNYPDVWPAAVGQLFFDPRSPATLYAVAGGAVFEITFVP
jgi:photosystem II stability/assembly factor-like uncharacterized protein